MEDRTAIEALPTVGVSVAARMLSVSASRVRQLCEAGKLDVVPSCYGRQVTLQSVDRLLAQRAELARDA